MDEQKDSQTDKQADRQTDRQTNKQTNRERERERESFIDLTYFQYAHAYSICLSKQQGKDAKTYTRCYEEH